MSLPDFELRLSVIPPENWRTNSGVTLESNKNWRSVRQSVLTRDNYTCTACGFRSMSYMEVHHKSGYWWDDSADNLGTFCPLCHSCFHIGLAGMQERGTLLMLDHERINESPFLRQNYLHRSILESIVAYKNTDKVLNALRRKMKPYIKEDLGSEGLIQLGNQLLSVLRKGDIATIPRSDRNVMFFPYGGFPIFEKLSKG